MSPGKKRLFYVEGVNRVTVIQYLGGYIVYVGSQAAWMQKKLRDWSYWISTMSGVACRHLQAAYAGLKKSLLQKWAFMQYANQRIGDDFKPVEKDLWG